MGKPIKIRLLPGTKDKKYKPLPGYADLWVLMNKLHINTIGELYEAEHNQVSELELKLHKLREELYNNYKEESCLNILDHCLEKICKSFKKYNLTKNIADIKHDEINYYNKILFESDLHIKENLKNINIKELDDGISKIIADTEENLSLIREQKKLIQEKTTSISLYMLKMDTIIENINSSFANIDTLDILLKHLESYYY